MHRVWRGTEARAPLPGRGAPSTTPLRAPRRGGRGCDGKRRRGGRGGGTPVAGKKKKRPAPPRATSSTTNTAGRRTTGTAQQRKKKKKRDAAQQTHKQRGDKEREKTKGNEKKKSRREVLLTHPVRSARGATKRHTQRRKKKETTHAQPTVHRRNCPPTQKTITTDATRSTRRHGTADTPDHRRNGPPTRRVHPTQQAHRRKTSHRRNAAPPATTPTTASINLHDHPQPRTATTQLPPTAPFTDSKINAQVARRMHKQRGVGSTPESWSPTTVRHTPPPWALPTP